MWRARLTVYCIVIAVAVTSGYVNALPDPTTRSLIGLLMNLGAIPTIEIVLKFLRHEAVKAALLAARDPRVRAARQQATPPAPDPLH